jgi:hypothetical protein
MLAMPMAMRSSDVGMVGQVAMCVVCRNPVTTAAADHPRFMGTFLIDRMAFV